MIARRTHEDTRRRALPCHSRAVPMRCRTRAILDFPVVADRRYSGTGKRSACPRMRTPATEAVALQ